MTSAGALSNDAINMTLQPGRAAVLVTEYMPGDPGCQVINTAVAGTVYLGTTSSVQASNGVPVPAGSSVQWVHDGQLWAIAGPDATAPILLVTTGCISSWAPSPETIALATAAQLLASGIPNVLTETVLLAGVNLPAGSSFAADVSGYASLTLTVDSNVGAPVLVETWFNVTGSGDVFGDDQLTAPALGGLAQEASAELAVIGSTFQMLNNDAGNAVHVTLIGSNRPPSAAHAIENGFCSVGAQFSVNSIVMAVNDIVNMPLVVGTMFQGPAVAEFEIRNSTVVKGFFSIVTTVKGAAPNTLVTRVTDTTEPAWHLLNATTQIVYKNLAMPGAQYAVQFQCTTAGTSGLTLRAIPAY